MPLKEAFMAELKHESSLTKKMLERVPLEKKEWVPHEKSMTLGRLATHVAQTTGWISNIIRVDEYDFATRYNPPLTAATSEELLKIFQDTLDAALDDLSKTSEEEFNKRWIVRVGEKVMYDTPKKVAIRGWAFSHLIHHRGQLSVYLRLLDVAVPGMYGPSADEK
jgi:uncharacterized damage-inducible protein DinB